MGHRRDRAPDWPGVLAFEAKMVDKLVTGLTGLFKHRGVEVIGGTAASSHPRSDATTPRSR